MDHKFQRELFNEQLKAHHFEVKHWRRLETMLQLQAQTHPEEVIVLSYDDTSAMGFPRMTNRPIKSMPNDRVYMTPFNLTNHGTGENIYIYDFKHKWRHGADRLCTNLYFVLSRIKFKNPESSTRTEKTQRLTRKLVLMADNCTENKNNPLFQFLAELIMRGWFDDIELLFGPVGHTHNGNDAVHYIHNQIAGNYCSITPAELFQNYNHAWHKERSRPQPVIIESQFAWSDRFSTIGIPLQGFTTTRASPTNVRAFWFSVSLTPLPVEVAGDLDNSRQVELKIKGSPSAQTWYGEDCVPNAKGFHVLKGLPPGYPLCKKPRSYRIPQEYLTRLKGQKMRDYCASQGREAMFANFVEMAETYTVPSLGPVTAEQWSTLSAFRKLSMSGYGPIERIGVPGCVTYFVPFIRDRPSHQTEQSFWALPGQAGSGGAGVPIPMPASSLSNAVPMVSYAPVPVPRKKKSKRKRKTIRPSPDEKQESDQDEHEEGEEEEEVKSQRAPTKRAAPTKRTTSQARKRPAELVEPDRPDNGGSQPENSTDESSGSEAPGDWEANMDDAKVGTFAVVETVYAPNDGGISLSQVAFCFGQKDSFVC